MRRSARLLTTTEDLVYLPMHHSFCHRALATNELTDVIDDNGHEEDAREMMTGMRRQRERARLQARTPAKKQRRRPRGDNHLDFDVGHGRTSADVEREEAQRERARDEARERGKRARERKERDAEAKRQQVADDAIPETSELLYGVALTDMHGNEDAGFDRDSSVVKFGWSGFGGVEAHKKNQHWAGRGTSLIDVRVAMNAKGRRYAEAAAKAQGVNRGGFKSPQEFALHALLAKKGHHDFSEFFAEKGDGHARISASFASLFVRKNSNHINSRIHIGEIDSGLWLQSLQLNAPPEHAFYADWPRWLLAFGSGGAGWAPVHSTWEMDGFPVHGFLRPRLNGTRWSGTQRPRQGQRHLGLSAAREPELRRRRLSGLWPESPDDGHGAGCDEDGDAVGPAAVRQQNRDVRVFGVPAPRSFTRFNSGTWDSAVATAKHKRSAAQTRRALVAGEITVRAVIADYHDPTAWSALVTWLQSALGAVVVVHGGGGGHPRPASAVAAVASAFALKEAPCFLTSDTSCATGLGHVEAAVHVRVRTSRIDLPSRWPHSKKKIH
jgi:hypothetical protein